MRVENLSSGDDHSSPAHCIIITPAYRAKSNIELLRNCMYHTVLKEREEKKQKAQNFINASIEISKYLLVTIHLHQYWFIFQKAMCTAHDYTTERRK